MELASDSKLYTTVSLSLAMQHCSCYGSESSVGIGGVGCIEHTVTKFDTLAGVAIKYGVEVADIKRMNGLTTDIQMFARKSLKIPLSGRHPPSPIMSKGYHTQGQTSSEVTRSIHTYSDSFSSIRSLKLLSSPKSNISSSINSLKDYYGLQPYDQKGVTNVFEMTKTNTPLGHHRKSKSENNGFSKTRKMLNDPVPNDKGAASDKSIDKLVRRRKSEVDLNNRTPEDLVALQPKVASNHTTTEPESGAPNLVPLRSRDSSMAQAFTRVRKSSSSPSFQQSETDSNDNYNSPASLSIWPISMLNFTADLQATSIAAIASPLFDGLPKPASGRKKKAACD